MGWRDFDEMIQDTRGFWLAWEYLRRLRETASAAGIPDSVVEPLAECAAQVQPHGGCPSCDSAASECPAFWDAGALVCRHVLETRQDAEPFLRGWLLGEAERAEDTAARLREG
jgi:hypothetical protein